MHDAQHHVQKRKKGEGNLEPYPSENKWKHLMDKLIWTFGIIGPILTIPQIIKIWVDKNASGVSLISWVGFLVVAIFWILYGVMHKEKSIIFTYSLWILAELIIVIGIIIYG